MSLASCPPQKQGSSGVSSSLILPSSATTETCKIIPKVSDFRHHKTGKPLCINRIGNPPLIKENLKDVGLVDSKVKILDNDDDDDDDDDGDVLSKVQFHDQVRVLNLIKSCRKEKNILRARKIHARIVEENLISKNVYIATALITTFAKCGALREAQEVFDQLPVRDVFSWSALIGGYAQNKLGDKALVCFKEMHDAGVRPNGVTYINILKACGIVGSIEVGAEIDVEVRRQGLLEKDIVLGTALVDMYCKCGLLEKAREVFEKLPKRNVVTWSSLIAGYAQNGLGDEALKCFKRMKDAGVCPNSVTYIGVVKACSILGSLDVGEDVYVEVKRQGFLQKDVVLGNAMVDMYAKCGEMEKARKVFEQLQVQSAVSWNTLIAGYAQNGLGDESLTCFSQMKNAKVCPDVVTYICILKACGMVGSLKIGEIINTEVRKQGLEKDVMIGTALVDMYAKCNALEKAREVFDELLLHDVISWNALICGYVHHGLGGEALKCFRKMKDSGVCPDQVTYVSSLKACGIMGSLEIGEDIAADVRKKGLFPKDIMLGNALVDMYSKCSALEKARDVFDQLPFRDVVSWNALISGYVKNGIGDEALKCFRQMQNAGITPDVVTYICIAKACGIVRSLDIGERIDADVRKQRLLEKDVVLGTALVDMYSKCGSLEKAREVFEKLPEQNVVSWSSLIAAYVQNGLANEALECFRQMQNQGVCPNAVSYVSILKACGIAGSLEIGEDIDTEVRRQGLLENDVVLGTALVDMYSKCGVLEKAQKVFEQLLVRNVATWNALISGYVQHGFANEALKCFREMEDAEVCPNKVTYICILKACSIMGSADVGVGIDVKIRKEGLFQKDIVLGNALMDMYSKCGSLEKAREVFEQLPVHDIVSWNTLLNGYAQNGLGDQALKYFRRMQTTQFSPDAVTYICILKACGSVGSLEMGVDIDAKIRKQGLLERDVVLGTALMDMYSKCGALEKAQEVFAQLPEQNVVTWNALISAYGQLGGAHVILNIYNKIRAKEVVPNSVTFLVLLNACSHAGLLKEGETFYDEMCYFFCVNPTLEHYTCMVDLFGRAGQFDKVATLLANIHHSNHLPLLKSVLGSCGKWSNVELGRWAFEQLVQLDKECAAVYVCMEKIYAAAEMQIEAG